MKKLVIYLLFFIALLFSSCAEGLYLDTNVYDNYYWRNPYYYGWDYYYPRYHYYYNLPRYNYPQHHYHMPQHPYRPQNTPHRPSTPSNHGRRQ